MNPSPATEDRATVDADEIAKFSRMAATWWDVDGTSGPLHRLNPARLGYIRKQVISHLSQRERSTDASRAGEGQIGEVSTFKPFTSLSFADIGCGGGIVCEPLARLGAQVTGVDASEEAIAVARQHAAEAGLTIDYRAGTSSDLLAGSFDVVLALEVVEHVADVAAFIASLKALMKPGGLLILSTPNRTPQSYLSVIVGAERIMRWLPRGTHEWRRFLKPPELARHVRDAGVTVQDVSGITYDALKREFSVNATDVSVNYLLTAKRA